MVQNSSANLGSLIGKKLVRVAIIVVALLAIRVLLDSLPMLKNAEPIVFGSTAVGMQQGYNPFNPNDPTTKALQQYYGNLISQFMQNGQIDQNQAQSIQNQLARGLMPRIILPIAIVNAVVDTLIFVVLIFAAFDFSNLIRANAKRFHDGGAMLILATFVVVIVFAYQSYAYIVPPLLGISGNIYDWFFILLGLAAVVGLIVVAYRNIDIITDKTFDSTREAVARVSARQAGAKAPACPKCGQALEKGAKFCGNCGAPAPVIAAPVVAPPVFCSACGTKNSGGSKNCKSCGKPLAAVT